MSYLTILPKLLQEFNDDNEKKEFHIDHDLTGKERSKIHTIAKDYGLLSESYEIGSTKGKKRMILKKPELYDDNKENRKNTNKEIDKEQTKEIIKENNNEINKEINEEHNKKTSKEISEEQNKETNKEINKIDKETDKEIKKEKEKQLKLTPDIISFFIEWSLIPIPVNVVDDFDYFLNETNKYYHGKELFDILKNDIITLADYDFGKFRALIKKCEEDILKHITSNKIFPSIRKDIEKDCKWNKNKSDKDVPLIETEMGVEMEKITTEKEKTNKKLDLKTLRTRKNFYDIVNTNRVHYYPQQQKKSEKSKKIFCFDESKIIDNFFYISVDVKKGNFTTLNSAYPGLFDDCNDWESFVAQMTPSKFIQKSKHFREKIFGKLNTTKIVFQLCLQLIEQIICLINNKDGWRTQKLENLSDHDKLKIEILSYLSIIKENNFKLEIVHVDYDEVIFKIIDESNSLQKRIEFLKQTKMLIEFIHPNKFHVKGFKLIKLGPKPYFVKEHLDNTIEFKCCPIKFIMHCIKYYQNEQCNAIDLQFTDEMPAYYKKSIFSIY